jgi:hypothetical protein
LLRQSSPVIEAFVVRDISDAIAVALTKRRCSGRAREHFLERQSIDSNEGAFGGLKLKMEDRDDAEA